MNKKRKNELEALYRANNDANSRIDEIFQELPMFIESETGKMKPTHPFVSTFGNEVQHGVFKINATLANHILTHFNNIVSENPALTRRNRPLMKSNRDKYARSMEKGDWMVSAPLLFEKESGALLDGQNRLSALVKLAEKYYPDNLSECAFDFNVSFGCDSSVQDFIDKGTPRTLTQTAKMKGLISMKDSNGVDALRILQSLMWKQAEGNEFNSSLAIDTDVFDKWLSIEPNTGQTYEDICRWISEECCTKNSAYDLQLGHKVLLTQAYIFNHEEINTFVRCITADHVQLKQLESEGIDTNFDTDEFSSVKVCRKYLQTQEKHKKVGGSYSGSSKPIHYGFMLGFVDNFLRKANTKNKTHKVLTCNKANKHKKAYVSFGYFEEEDAVKSILNTGSKNNAKKLSQKKLDI
jgi:hypothetical protein